MTRRIRNTPTTYVREVELSYRRRASAAVQDTKGIATSRDVVALVQPLIGNRIVESLLVLALSARNRVLGYHEVGRGTVSSCGVERADVFRYPLVVGANAVIVAHNHPSGSATPSEEDIAFTRVLVQAGKILGLPVLDHVIVADEASYSFLDAGLMVP